MEPQATYLEEPEPRLMGVPVSEVTEILARAAQGAVARHRALGIPVVIWRDGKPVEVPAEELGG